MDGSQQIQEDAGESFPEKGRMERIKKYVSENLAGNLDVTTVSREINVNKFTLQFIFKRYQQETFHQYVERVRIDKALHLLREGKWVKEVIDATGYKNRVTFNKAFKRRFKHPASYFKK